MAYSLVFGAFLCISVFIMLLNIKGAVYGDNSFIYNLPGLVEPSTDKRILMVFSGLMIILQGYGIWAAFLKKRRQLLVHAGIMIGLFFIGIASNHFILLGSMMGLFVLSIYMAVIIKRKEALGLEAPATSGIRSLVPGVTRIDYSQKQ